MSREQILSNYDRFQEEKRAYGTRSEQMEFLYTKKLLDQYIHRQMDAVEVGCGTGYYGLYLQDKCKSYHGVDLVPRHVEMFQETIAQRRLSNLSASVGDATHLHEILDQTFDVVLVLGPMYHLPREERVRVILESKRICKTGGVILFAYINKIGAYLRACIDESLKSNYPNQKANQLVLVQGTDDVMPGVFFYTTPEEMECDAAAQGLQIIRNAGVDFTFNPGDVNRMDDKTYAAWMQVTDCMFDSSSCTGVSGHAVLVCKK